MKRNTVREQGMSLVIVPCWWDGTLESLSASIKFARPELMIDNLSSPISLNSPLDYFDINQIPDVGELMLASFPSQRNFSSSTAVQNSWWMGEKYDGIRCCWNSKQNILYPINTIVFYQNRFSRTGKELVLPVSFLSQFPNTNFLDGEIWSGRGQFSDSIILLHASSETIHWEHLRMLAFDDPSRSSRNEPFEIRYTDIISSVSIDNPCIAGRVKCINNKQIKMRIEEIIEDGGEGVILRMPASPYVHGRNDSLFKLKAAYMDAEALVVGIEKNNSVRLLQTNGKEFTVMTQNVHIPVPKIGQVVSYSFESVSRRESPSDPKIFRVRSDLEWDHILFNHHRENHLNASSQVSEFKSHPIGYWTTKNMRLFLEKFAKQRNLDPLLAETWYQISREDIKKTKGGSTLFHKAKGGYIQILSQLFPEIQFDKLKLDKAPPMHWSSIENRRNFFEKYAKENQFDPLVPEHWYSHPRSQMSTIKGMGMILSYHNYSVAKALIDLFPNIGLVRSKFYTANWTAPAMRRKFFEKYAKENQFDPLTPENWYFQPFHKILSLKGAERIMSFHGNSVPRALCDLFPEISLNPSMFHSNLYWMDVRNRRKFFEKYAKENGFDPKDPEGWYKQNKKQILETKGVGRVLKHHGGVRQALRDLFPDLNFVHSRLLPSANLWGDPASRRKFFEEYASSNSFDPLVADNWYNQPKEKIMALKGADRVVFYHDNDVVKALSELFTDIKFDKSKFYFTKLWSKVENRRKFFEDYAHENGFEAQDAEQWYLQPLSKIMSFRGAFKVMLHHRNSVAKALLDLFPNIGLAKKRLSSIK